MLYSLIPPILIVLSLIGIILMLVKKSTQVASLPEDHFEQEDGQDFQKRGFASKIMWRIKKIRWDDVKHFFLAILEKIARKSRVIFLKLESRFGSLSNDIRAKRQARTNKTLQNSESRPDQDILKKLKDYKLAEKNEQTMETTEAVVSSEKADRKKVGKKNEPEEEREVKPMISEKVVQPRVRTEIKDRLEELLIERIAINPKDIEAYERLGEYYMEIKSYMDAKECFKQVIKLNPSDRNAKYRMRRLENILAKQ